MGITVYDEHNENVFFSLLSLDREEYKALMKDGVIP
ncbi:MAG: hypothetical protein HW402_722 [Dehalococcoidales bacterium]|nr:hypothetical protein [Dehalococcoidales bacterium]